MKRLVTVLGALGLAAVLPLAGATHPTYAGSAFVATATGAEAPALVGAISQGALPASTPLHITVALPMRNASGIQSYLRQANTSGAAFGSSLTPAEFTAQYGATTTQVGAVESYLQSQGFSGVTASANHLLVTGDATAAQAEAAFNTAIGQYSQHGRTIFANVSAAQVPAALSGDVVAVLGLTNAGQMTVKPHAPNVTSYLQSYNPQDFANIYDATNSLHGSYTPIAIFTQGDVTPTVADLRTAEAANHLPQVPVTVVQTGVSAPIVAGAAGEWSMDTQYSTGMAYYVKRLYIYTTTTLTDSDIALNFNRFATDNLAKAGSASFGECEHQAYLDGSMQVDDMIFAEAALQGQTVFASAGDTGGFCPVAPTNGVPAGVPLPNYPASSAYVTSVGGTTLFTSGTPSQNGGPSHVAYDSELAWTAGGGGPSAFENQPYWQSGVTPPTSTTCVTTVGCLGRNVPDIAMDADPNSGANVYIGGAPTGVGGTSLSSPLALGVWARLESQHNNTIGFASPNLYRACGSAGYHDITLGNTGPYPAAPGWDYATGCGTFDISKMQAAIVPASVAVKPLTLIAPACTTVTDTNFAPDAQPTGSQGNVDSLDIVAAGFKNTDAKSITAQIRVVSLSDGIGGQPALAGDGDNWYATFSYGGTTYFLSAQYPTGSPNTSNPTSLYQFSYGTITKSPTGGVLYNTVGSATGSVDTATSILTMTAPRSVLGNPGTGAVLTSTGASTLESIGTPVGGLLEAANSVGPGSNYTVGSSC